MLADYLRFSELETQYLLALVEFERAGTQRLRVTLKKRMARLKEQSRALFSIVPGKRELNESEKVFFIQINFTRESGRSLPFLDFKRPK